jgi:hypothetical protein
MPNLRPLGIRFVLDYRAKKELRRDLMSRGFVKMEEESIPRYREMWVDSKDFLVKGSVVVCVGRVTEASDRYTGKRLANLPPVATVIDGFAEAWSSNYDKMILLGPDEESMTELAKSIAQRVIVEDLGKKTRETIALQLWPATEY